MHDIEQSPITPERPKIAAVAVPTARSLRPRPPQPAPGPRRAAAIGQPRLAPPPHTPSAPPRPEPARQRGSLAKFVRTPKGYLLAALLVLLAVALPGQGILAVRTTIASVLAAVLVECIVRRTLVPPTSALLTGLFVAMVMDPHDPLAVVVATSGAAIAAKHLLRTSRAHIFNPAALALALAPLLLGAGESWWGATAGLPIVALVPLLLAGYLVVGRVNKLPSVLTFLGVYFALFTAAAVWVPGESTHLAQFYRDPFVGAALFFAFFMLTDPPTSPVRSRDQLVFGAGVAALAVGVELTRDTLTYLFVGLLIGNAWWAWRRLVAMRTPAARAAGTAMPPVPVGRNTASAGVRPPPVRRAAPRRRASTDAQPNSPATR